MLASKQDTGLAVKATTFLKVVVQDRVDFLDRFIALLHDDGIRYCVIGGQAVNAYTDPIVSLDLDIVVAVDDQARFEPLMRAQFVVERFPHSLNISMPGSNLHAQIQTDPRYHSFVDHAPVRDVLGLELPVASLEGLLQDRVWAASDPSRRPTSTRLKDLADISRLIESNPDLRANVPAEILGRLL